MKLLGHYICKIERFLFPNRIRCSNCECWINGNFYDGDTGLTHNYKCNRFKKHFPLDWQYCDYWDSLNNTITK